MAGIEGRETSGGWIIGVHDLAHFVFTAQNLPTLGGGVARPLLKQPDP